MPDLPYVCVICTTPIDKLYSIWDNGAPIVTHAGFCSVCLAVLKVMAKVHQSEVCDIIDCNEPRTMNGDRCLLHAGHGDLNDE
jgi:hypothetical protein